MIIMFQCLHFKRVIMQCFALNENEQTFKTYTTHLKNCAEYSFEKISDKIFEVKANTPFDVYERTDDVFEAAIIITPFYAGVNILYVNSVVDDKTFIVNEKLPLQRIKDTWDSFEPKYNDTLFHTTLEHIEKPAVEKMYLTDMTTKIQLDMSHEHLFYKKV